MLFERRGLTIGGHRGGRGHAVAFGNPDPHGTVRGRPNRAHAGGGRVGVARAHSTRARGRGRGGAGRSNAEIASRLFMSEATGTGHAYRVMARLGGSNRVQVTIVVGDADLG